MATSVEQEDEQSSRLYRLLMKIAPRALRRRFDYEFHPQQLKQFLSKNRREIHDLTYRDIIKPAQHDLLYPKDSSKVSSEMFDISLMVCLLRNFSDLDIQDNLPVETIHTTAADISRIKFYRNHFVHSESGTFAESKFFKIWNSVVEAILRLVPDLKSQIDELMRLPLSNDRDTIEIINEREIHKKTLQEWKEIDTKYVSTSGTTFILQSLTQNMGVIITGSPGCGKSFAAHHVALAFEKEGYEIIPCDQFSEIKRHFLTNKLQVFVIDDICGKFALNQQNALFWERDDSKLKKLLHSSKEKNQISSKADAKFIITCRENIYSHKAFPKLACLTLVQCSFFTKYKITPDEMRNIALSYLPENTVDGIHNICQYVFFPLLCSLYCKTNDKYPDFFNHPVEIIKKEISEMKTKSEISFLCLSLLVIKNNKCYKKVIFSGIEELVTAICRDSELESVISPVAIQKCFERLEGIYITESDNVYTAIHDKMFDIISAAIAPYIMNCLIEHVDIAFIAHRIQLYSCRHGSLPFRVYIPAELERNYLKRQHKEAMKGKYWEVFGSMQSENEKYRKLLLSFLKEPETPQNIAYVPDKDGATPLFVSSYLGYVDFVEYFTVKCQRHIDVKDKQGRSSFYVACENGHIETVKYLMKFHYDIDMIDAENARKTTALSATCLNGHTEVAKLLLENHADINQTNKLNQSAIHFACSNGNAKLVQQLLYSKYDVDTTIKDYWGKTALHVACEKGHTDTVRLMLKFGMNIIQGNYFGEYNKTKIDVANELKNLHTTGSGWTVIHAACSQGHTEVLNLLIDIGMSVNDTTNYGVTPLCLACKNGHIVTVKFLLDLKDKTLISCVKRTIKDKQGQSVLHAACYSGHTEIVKLLIDDGMNVNETTSSGVTPLCLACTNGHIVTVKLLLALKDKTLVSSVKRTIKDKRGQSVLHAASYFGHTEIVKLLIDVGMNINDTTDDGSTPLHLSCQEGKYDTVKYILDLNDQTSKRRIDLTIKQRDQWSVLHVACYSGHTETVKLLIDAGMNVNERTRNGSTPLYLACQEGKYDTVKLLLDLNGQTLDSPVDTTIKDVDGFSILHAASSARHSKIVKLLSDVGMNANDI